MRYIYIIYIYIYIYIIRYIYIYIFKTSMLLNYLFCYSYVCTRQMSLFGGFRITAISFMLQGKPNASYFILEKFALLSLEKK